MCFYKWEKGIPFISLKKKRNRLKKVIKKYIEGVEGLKEYCDRCLNTKRWGGNVILMIVDAGFTSIGLNYFYSVVPKVEKIEKIIKENGVKKLEDFFKIPEAYLEKIWKNKRSWVMIKHSINYLIELKRKEKLKNDRQTLRKWAENAVLQNWNQDPIGKIKGVGINTFQYLRMMGGVDTVMPDKVVKKVINRILEESGIKKFKGNDIDFIHLTSEIANITGHRAIELCWMSWLTQSEKGITRSEKYEKILQKI